jgi:hypothetical protein
MICRAIGFWALQPACSANSERYLTSWISGWSQTHDPLASSSLPLITDYGWVPPQLAPSWNSLFLSVKWGLAVFEVCWGSCGLLAVKTRLNSYLLLTEISAANKIGHGLTSSTTLNILCALSQCLSINLIAVSLWGKSITSPLYSWWSSKVQ